MAVKTIVRQGKLPILISQFVPLFPATTKSCALLNQFKPQDKPDKHFHEAKIKGSRLARVEKIYLGCTPLDDSNGFPHYHNVFLPQFQPLGHSAADVARFLQYFQAFDFIPNLDSELGQLMSALINTCKSRKMKLSLPGFPMCYLGLHNTKNLELTGNVGDFCFWGMEKGNIVVRGNAGRNAGAQLEGGTLAIYGNAYLGRIGPSMQGGTLILNGICGSEAGLGMDGGNLTINGSAGDEVGKCMKGGTITVNGNAGRDTGQDANGGTIIVNGNIGSLGFSKSVEHAVGPGGNIFQYDLQLVKDGKIIAEPINK